MNGPPELTYLVLRCADIERSRIFYEALGLTLVAEQHGSGSRHYACRIGGIVLELYPLQAEQSSGARLGLRVADPDAVIVAVRAAGGEVVRVDAGGVLVRDPDGHKIHLERIEAAPAEDQQG